MASSPRSPEPPARPAPLQRDLVASLEKGLAVIAAFDQDRPRMTISEVAQRCGLTRAAARRYLLTLEHLGFVSCDRKMYALTAKVLRQIRRTSLTGKSGKALRNSCRTIFRQEYGKHHGSFAPHHRMSRRQIRVSAILQPGSGGVCESCRLFGISLTVAWSGCRRTIRDRAHAVAKQRQAMLWMDLA